MKFIKLKDKQETIINLEKVECITTETINGSNKYFNFNFYLSCGKFKQVRYEEYEERELLGDIHYIEDNFVSSRK